MAAAKDDKDKNGSESKGGETGAAEAKGDLIDQIGTLTYPRAVQHFGKDKAIEVMHKVAEIGGHGLFEESHFKSPLFGGLQMPDPAKVEPPREADFAALPEAEFHFAAAMETFEEQKKAAGENRKRINDLYKSVKS